MKQKIAELIGELLSKDIFLRIVPQLFFTAICWLIGGYFFFTIGKTITWSCPDSIHIIHLIVFGLSIILILFPFIKSLKIGSLVELSRSIEETKTDVKEFKNEVRQSLAMISNSVSASIGNMNNRITVNTGPSIDEIRQEIKKFTDNAAEPENAVIEVKQELLLENEDLVMALARTRIRIEYLMRDILKKRTLVNVLDREIKFMSLGKLFQEFIKSYPELEWLSNSFQYVMQAGNSAIHAQKIDQGQAAEALELGARVISKLIELRNK